MKITKLEKKNILYTALLIFTVAVLQFMPSPLFAEECEATAEYGRTCMIGATNPNVCTIHTNNSYHNSALTCDGICCQTNKGTTPNPPSSDYDYKPLEPIFDNDTDGGFIHYIQMIYKFMIWTVGIAALLMLMIGGFMYMTSAGNKANAETAKKIIKDALLGLIIVLTAWVILYLINPDLIKINLQSIKKIQVTLPNPPAGAGPGAPRVIPIGDPVTLPTDLPKGCENYKEDFHNASGGNKDLECLLNAVAATESACNPNAESPVGACGMMQFMPSTAGKSCDWLKTHPKESVQLAANFLAQNQSTLNGYGYGGTSLNQSGSNTTISGYTYDTGNMNLIASYNAGAGREPFSSSQRCASEPGDVLVWQCSIPSPVLKRDGYRETKGYVQKVQSYQNMCLQTP